MGIFEHLESGEMGQDTSLKRKMQQQVAGQVPPPLPPPPKPQTLGDYAADYAKKAFNKAMDFAKSLPPEAGLPGYAAQAPMASTKPTEPATISPQDRVAAATEPATDFIGNALRASGNKEKDYLDGAIDLTKALGLLPEDYEKPVDFQAAIQQGFRSGLLDELVDEMANVSSELSQRGIGAQTKPTATKTALTTPMDTETQLRHDYERAYRDLAEAKEMQSWPAVLMYLLLSLAVGPQISLITMTRAWRHGQLKSKVDEFAQKLKWYEQDKKKRDEQEWWYRKFATERMAKQQDMEQAHNYALALETQKFNHALDKAKMGVDLKFEFNKRFYELTALIHEAQFKIDQARKVNFGADVKVLEAEVRGYQAQRSQLVDTLKGMNGSSVVPEQPIQAK